MPTRLLRRRFRGFHLYDVELTRSIGSVQKLTDGKWGAFVYGTIEQKFATRQAAVEWLCSNVVVTFKSVEEERKRHES